VFFYKKNSNKVNQKMENKKQAGLKKERAVALLFFFGIAAPTPAEIKESIISL
jgi:hypothetical protein